MKVLLIILGIILFFVLVLSIRVVMTVHSEDGVELSVKWLFLKFNILPKKEKKEKKPKKEKKKKEENKEEIPKEKTKSPKSKDNMFVRFYHNNGVSGVVELLGKLKESLGGMFRRIGRAFVFDELFISLLVSAGDSAETAIKYGKVCGEVFPAVGFLTSNMKVKKYNVDINPDFIHNTNKARLHTKISVRPIKLINAVILLVFSLLFKVVIKFLKGSKAEKVETSEKEKNTNQNEKGEKQ